MQVTKKVYLIAAPGSKYNIDTHMYEECVEFTPWPYETYGDKHPFVASVDVVFEVADAINCKDLKLAALRAEQKTLQADFNKRITEIQSQINQLTAIEADIK